MEKTTSEYEDALKKKKKQTKLMADENNLLKEEAALHKEKANLAEEKLTDLHRMLARQGVRVDHTLNGGVAASKHKPFSR